MSATGPVKRKRKQVDLACQRCRQKKISCDGQRPSCDRCSSIGFTCEYDIELLKDESRVEGKKRQYASAKGLVERITKTAGFLSGVPNEYGAIILQRLKDADDPLEALCSLPHFQPLHQAPGLSNYKAARSAFPPTRSRLAYELSISHRSSYPLLVPVDLALTPVELHTGAVKSPRQHKPSLADQSSATLPAWTGPSAPSTIAATDLLTVDFARWTDVPIANSLAASLLSRYFEVDHPLVGWFDAELFLASLKSGYEQYCSPLLVSALLHWSCHGAVATGGQIIVALRDCFLHEARSRWALLSGLEDNILTVAACMILHLSLITDGEEALGEQFRDAGTSMSERLGLYDTEVSPFAIDLPFTANDYRAKSHVAWGAYNWMSLYAGFYSGIPPRIPPRFHVPR